MLHSAQCFPQDLTAAHSRPNALIGTACGVVDRRTDQTLDSQTHSWFAQTSWDGPRFGPGPCAKVAMEPMEPCKVAELQEWVPITCLGLGRQDTTPSDASGLRHGRP